MKKRKSIIMGIIAIYLFIAASGISMARELKGVNFPEIISIHGTNCKLNGLGIRKKLIINVYIGALYLAQPEQSAVKVISSEQAKRVFMHFLYREVTAKQLVEAWNEGFEKNAGDTVRALKGKISRFDGFFTEPMKKGETMSFTYIPGQGTEVVIRGEKKGIIEGHDFMEALFSIWFGPSPPSKGLKEGMLGK